MKKPWDNTISISNEVPGITYGSAPGSYIVI